MRKVKTGQGKMGSVCKGLVGISVIRTKDRSKTSSRRKKTARAGRCVSRQRKKIQKRVGENNFLYLIKKKSRPHPSRIAPYVPAHYYPLTGYAH